MDTDRARPRTSRDSPAPGPHPPPRAFPDPRQWHSTPTGPAPRRRLAKPRPPRGRMRPRGGVRARLPRRGVRKTEVTSAAPPRASADTEVGPARTVAVSGSRCSGDMLAALGLIGTLGEDDEVPAEPESDSGDDEEVGAHRGWGRSGGQPGVLVDRFPSPRFLCPPIPSIPQPGWLGCLEEPLTGTPRSSSVRSPPALPPGAGAIALCPVAGVALTPGPVAESPGGEAAPGSCLRNLGSPFARYARVYSVLPCAAPRSKHSRHSSEQPRRGHHSPEAYVGMEGGGDRR